ncbi:MAG: HrpE/YscL family type III secretion apparatus protein [Desulfobacterales bacterium]|nr:HrpE/YscL family type III secretion apparatus protein [Desulfobacterales bacterium]
MKKQSLTPPAGQRILKQADYGRLIEADAILEEARKTASETLAQAMEIYEARKKQGYEDGLEEGRMQHAEKIMDTAMEAINYFESMEKSIAGLVTQCLEKVLGEMDQEELILRIVKNGLAVARNEKKVVVRVCDTDLKRVNDAVSTMLQTYPGISVLDISADARLTPGACIIESELGVVDASLDTQLTAIKRAIARRI